MEFNKGRKIRLGLFILLGFAIFVTFFYLIGSSSRLFSRSITLHTQFPSVSGLRTGDHVRFSGIIIGTVSELQITSDTTVYVDMSVERKMLKFIRKDSRVEIKPEALIGDKMLVIYSGTADSDHVSEGDFLQPVGTVHLEDVVHDLSKELRKTDRLISNLIDVSDKINHGDGNAGRLLNDSSIAIKLDRSADHFLAITRNLQTLSEKLNNPGSDFGRLLHDDMLTTRMDTILVTLKHAVSNTEMATKDLSLTASELRMASQAIQSGNGSVNKLLYDSVFADTLDVLVGNLNQTLQEVQNVAVNLQHKRLFGGQKQK